MLKVMIVDDEQSMRFVLKKALEKINGIQIISEASSGDEAVYNAETWRPDVIFMDVDMPGINGIEAAKLIIDIIPKCMIIFLTAHEQYMSEAFELYAFDYIVKPFKLERLNQTINRIQLIHSNYSLSNVNNEKEPPMLDDILLKNKDGMVIIHPNDILMVQRENRSTIIVTKKEKFSTTETLSQLEEKLPSSQFLRCHKSYIIQVGKISRIYPYGRWTYIIKFDDIKEDALLTKEKAAILQSKFKFTIG